METGSSGKVAVVAIGGNSLILHPKNPSMADQWRAAQETCEHIADMICEGWRVIITHGNGPQVGFILRRMEIAAEEVHTMELDIISADTQGATGYIISTCLENCLKRRGIDKTVTTVITRVLVDKNDLAFQIPTKGIGKFLDPNNNIKLIDKFRREGWVVKDDAGRGHRRMIASPKPLQIMELKSIRTLIDSGTIVVAVGGGGIPIMYDDNGKLTGARAVIDKDYASSLLADQLNADLLLISTAVEQVCIDYRKPTERPISSMTLSEAKYYLENDQFPAGSIGPKIDAIIKFLQEDRYKSRLGLRSGLITDPPNIVKALNHESGTWLCS